MNLKSIEKLSSIATQHKVYCKNKKCKGHGIFFITGKDRLICKNCGNYVYKDKKTELFYKMKENGII